MPGTYIPVEGKTDNKQTNEIIVDCVQVREGNTQWDAKGEWLEVGRGRVCLAKPSEGYIPEGSKKTIPVTLAAAVKAL